MKVFALCITLTFVVACSLIDQTAARSDTSIEDDYEDDGWEDFPCSCNNNGQCSCCFNAPVYGEKGCLNARLVGNKMQYDLNMGKLPLVSSSFALALSGNGRACTQFKSPLNNLSVCLNTYSTSALFGTATCPSLQFFIDHNVAGTALLRCLEVHGGGRVSSGVKTSYKIATPFFDFPVQYVKALKAKIAAVKK